MRYRMAVAAEGGVSGGGVEARKFPQAAMEEMRHYYGFDKPVYTRYGALALECSAPESGPVVRLSGPGLGRHQGAVPGFPVFGFDGIFSSAIWFASRWASSRPSGMVLASICSAAWPSFSVTRSRAGRWGRRSWCCLEEAVSGTCFRSAVSVRTTGNTWASSRRSARRSTTCFFPCSAT